MARPTLLYTLPDFGVGGGQTILLRTATALAEAEPGIRQLVVGVAGGPMLDQFEAAGLPCRVLGSGPLPAAAALGRLIRLVRRERVSAICSFNTPLDRSLAQLASAATSTPVVIWFMSMAVPALRFPPPRGRELAFLKRAVLRPVNRISVRRATRLLALSDAVANSFAAHLNLPAERFAVVPPGLPEQFFPPQASEAERAEVRQELGVEGADPLLLCVGMLIELKGQQHLVPLMARIRHDQPNAVLLLVGEGELRPQLESEIAALELTGSVKLLGHRHDVPRLLRAADGLISASRSEGFGMAVLEAMAAGKPVVAAHTPAFDEFAVAGETAAFVAQPDAALLADAVRATFGTPGRAAAMGTAARRRAEEFRVEATARRLATELEPFLGPRGRPAAEITVMGGVGAGLRLGPEPASADYRAGDNEVTVQQAIVEHLEAGAVFYDVGANVGFFALLGARAVGPGGAVHAFEPVPRLAAAAQRNVARNGVAVEVHQIAVGGSDGEAALALARHPGGAALASAGAPPDRVGELQVTVRSIDSLVRDGLPLPTLVKIDVEGAELEVLEGMAGTVAAAHPAILCEVDASTGTDLETRLAAVTDRLLRDGYTVRRLPNAYPGLAWHVAHVLATYPVAG